MRIRTVAWLLAIALGFAVAARAGEVPMGVAALVEILPADKPEVAQAVLQELMKGAPDSVVELTKMLKVPGPDDDSKVRFTLHGLATYCHRPGAEAERKLFADTMAKQLESNLPPAVKGFLIRQLQLAGGAEAVPALGKFLLDQELCEYAVQAMLAIKDKAAIALLQEALPKAAGPCRVTIVQALGVLRAAKGQAAVAKALSDEDRETRLVAAFALANSADPAAVAPLLKGAEAEALYERSQMTDAALLLARRLGETGEKAAGAKLARQLLTSKASGTHVRCAALIALAAAAGEEAMDEVLAAMSSDDLDVRASGISAAIAMPGEKATQRWVGQLKGAKPAGKVAILDLLAKRGDAAALPAIIEAMGDADDAVRLAAIKAAATTGTEAAVPPLVARLAGENAAERSAAQSSLLQVPGEAATAAIVKALGAATPDAKATLLDILAGRKGREHLKTILGYTRDENPKVAAAAIRSLGKLADESDLPTLGKLLVEAKDDAVRSAAERALASACSRLADKDKATAAVAAALKDTQGATRAALLRVLGGIGTRAAYETIRAGLADASDDVKDAAIRALADWRDDTPAADLLQVAKTTAKEAHHVLALRGYVRMITVRGERSADERRKMCEQAMETAKRDDERRLVLSTVADIPTPEAMKMAEASLGNAALKNEAAIAVIRIAKAIGGGDPDAAKQAIAKAAAASDNPEVQKQAKEAVAFLERNEGFITTWMASGPYKGGKTSIVHDPEKPDAKDIKWKLVAATGQQPGFVDLNKELGAPGDCAGYLKCQVSSPKEQPAVLECGSDDGIKIWLNGTVVHDKDVPRSFALNEDKVKITLKEGWNPLLVKVVNGGGGWEAAVRLTAPEGGALQGIKLKAE
ncbi:MAG TPA: HEAT repeat domain-containing protein [Planctomycetota bacterium]|nr:HEAT repeat domain-containing protein [Planctomycetota bacterium]